jgi:hypothetical protein
MTTIAYALELSTPVAQCDVCSLNFTYRQKNCKPNLPAK